jgi:hypothetical protein
MSITLRNTKGSALTINELDANFSTIRSLMPSFNYVDTIIINHTTGSADAFKGITGNSGSGTNLFTTSSVLNLGVFPKFATASITNIITSIPNASMNSNYLTLESLTIETNILSSSLSNNIGSSQSASFSMSIGSFNYTNTTHTSSVVASWIPTTSSATYDKVPQGVLALNGVNEVGDYGTIRTSYYSGSNLNVSGLNLTPGSGWYYAIAIPAKWPTGTYKVQFTAVFK